MRIRDKFQDYLLYLKQKGLKSHTIREHKRFLFGAISHAKFLSEKKIRKLKLTDVVSIIEAGKNHGTFGSQRAVCVFRRYLKYLKESGVRLPFDYRDVEVPKVPYKEQPVFTLKELIEVLEAFPIDHLNTGARKMALSMRVLCEVLFATGMRISEALGLTKKLWGEIKEKREVIIKGKGGDERIVYFSERAIKWLGHYLQERIDNSLSMFVNSYGDPLLFVTAKSYILRFRKKLGPLANKVKFHTFRRTLATVLFERGANIKDVQVILGHKSERTTLRLYVKTNKKRAKKVHQRILAKV